MDKYDWITTVFSDWAFTFVTSFLYYQDYDTLNAKIYNIDTKEYDVVKWNELENVQYFYNFFKKHEQEFEEVIHESGE